ncbi:MAG: hypothetical protein E6J90_13455 [Deltaproteobacteria bacterium]|nr:MAG: hypothetical protein E6J91_34130 [Deltaproteobacteria bacterium]TMQ21834.1 MAG: hypothetical protein E6J90_13455 [Deltaproteobacteria bacterium]
MTSRRLAAVASLALCGAVLEPLVRDPDDDGFPLSTYPMFAAPRSAEVTLAHAQGATRDGRVRPLSPAQLDTGEVMQAFTTLQRAVAAGPEARAALCAAIAGRVAGDAALGDVAEIRIVSATHDAIGFVARGAPALREAVLVRCDVARGAP